MLCFFLLLKKPPLILGAKHSRGVWRSLTLSPESLSVTLGAVLGVGEEKHCWAMVKAVRSWGQSAASLQVEHSLGAGWILRGEKSRGNSSLTGGKCFS